MKTILPLIIFVLVVAGCGPAKAPAMKRVSSYDQIDEHYLKEVFIPNHTGSKLQLSNSVSLLNEHWAEFQDFMRQVEAGKIPVIQGFKLNWQSSLRRDGILINADYSERLGIVRGFHKRKDQDPYPMIFSFWFSTNGTLISAMSLDDSFEFDGRGKVISYQHK